MELNKRNASLFLFVVLEFVYLFGRMCQASSANCNLNDKDGLPSDACTFDLRMKGAHPREPDGYFCSGYDVEDILGVEDRQSADGYIVRYEALASADVAHHVLVFGCRNLRRKTGEVWRCGQVCDGDDQIIFAWAKNAPPLSLPKDVGQHIGRNTDIRHIVVQIHYANALNASDNSGIRLYTTKQRQPYVSGIYLLLGYGITIPRNTPKFHVDSSCMFDWEEGIVPFGFRTHAHSLCHVISGYKVVNGEYKLIGKGNPQWPQAFYPVEDKIRIDPGDILAARCTYNSTGRNRPTEIGSTANDEMCNFYIMYYMNSSMENSYRRHDSTCFQNEQRQVFRNIPADSDVPLPPNPALEGSAMGHHHHGMGGNQHDNTDKTKIDEPQVANERPLVDLHGNQQNTDKSGNRILSKNFGSQGKLSTSFGDNLLGDVYENNGQGYSRNKVSGYSGLDMQRPPSYLMDYPGLDDYYNEVVQQRSRNRLKKPIYDLYDSPNYDVTFSEFPKKSYPALSRNRNKIFNDKYDEFAASSKYNLQNTKANSSNADSQYRHGIAKVNQKQNQSKTALDVTDKSSEDVKLNKDLDLQFMSEVSGLNIGQVGGLAVNPAGDLYIFHRGSNIWSSLSFTPTNRYTQQSIPVDVDPILILDKNGALKRHFGKNRFYLPHGLSLDSDENLWLTDVALHQVFRVPRGQEKPDMTLGIRFEPGTDNKHFCKPSDVAVLSNREFFVSDGYCNSRIMKFNKNGSFIRQWGSQSSSWGSDGFPPPGTFNLPHGLALAEEKDLLCVADRENGRIQCFNLDGKFVRQMHQKKFGQSLYSVEYCPNHGGVLFAVNGPAFGARSEVTQGFTLDIDTGALVSMWNLPGKGMTHPHDVAVDSTNHIVYVGELNPRKVWKFQMSKKFYEGGKPANDTKSAENQGKSATSPGSNKHISMETSTLNVVTISSTPLYSTSGVVKSETFFDKANGNMGEVNSNVGEKTSNIGDIGEVNHNMGEKTSNLGEVNNNMGEVNSSMGEITHNSGEVNSNMGEVTSNMGEVTSNIGEVNSYMGEVNSNDSINLKNIKSSSKNILGPEQKSRHPEKNEEESEGFGPSVIIGTLLVVPVLMLVLITVLVRLHHTGFFKNCRRRSGKKSVFSLGNFLHSHKGFDRLSTEDDDHDFDNVLDDDSDNEEFNIVRKA